EPSDPVQLSFPMPDVDTGKPRTYGPDVSTDNRSAFGNALLDIAEANPSLPMAVLDCDLAPSVKTDLLWKKHPHRFFEAGVQEHSTAIIAGALSVNGVLTFFADFGVFGVDETFNQHRLSDINGTNLKLVCTHLGLDVGEDGKTHQCIDYLGVLRNLYGFKIIIPADPNQTDRAIRYIAKTPGNFLVGMGRSKVPIISDEQGRPLFGEGYEFEYGKVDLVREGNDGVVFAMGPMVYRAIQAWEMLRERGVRVRVLNVPCPVDLDREAVRQAAETGLVVTYEDHHIDTGLGSSVALALAEEGLSPKFVRMGIRTYGGSGKPDELFASQGLSPEDLVRTVLDALGAK
ncbi:MAG: transketolase, partial [Candidatus Latescibacterota bacterium]